MAKQSKFEHIFEKLKQFPGIEGCEKCSFIAAEIQSILKQRHDEYGENRKLLDTYQSLFEIFEKPETKREDFFLVMLTLKLMRYANASNHKNEYRDSLIDIAGYAILAIDDFDKTKNDEKDEI